MGEDLIQLYNRKANAKAARTRFGFLLGLKEAIASGKTRYALRRNVKKRCRPHNVSSAQLRLIGLYYNLVLKFWELLLKLHICLKMWLSFLVSQGG